MTGSKRRLPVSTRDSSRVSALILLPLTAGHGMVAYGLVGLGSLL